MRHFVGWQKFRTLLDQLDVVPALPGGFIETRAGDRSSKPVRDIRASN